MIQPSNSGQSALDGDELHTLDELCQAGKFSRVHLRRQIKQKRAPQPIKLSARALRFRRRDVIAWLNGKTDF